MSVKLKIIAKLYRAVNALLNLEKHVAEMLAHSRNTDENQHRDKWIDAQIVMQMLLISNRQLERLRNNKTLPFSKVCGKIYYKEKDIFDLLEKGYTGPARPGIPSGYTTANKGSGRVQVRV